MRVPARLAGIHKGFDRFDLAVGMAVAGLLLAIGLTILAGDRAGVGIVSLAPGNGAHSTAPIRVGFSEMMDTQSVEARFRIEPPVEGQFSWNGPQLTFTPRRAWKADTAYTVSIEAGAASVGGRRLNETVRHTFSVAPPRVLYLAPAILGNEVAASNLWMADPAQPAEQRQLTFSAIGIVDFQPSPDGEYVAYTQAGERGTMDIFVLEIEKGAARRITNCAAVDAQCLAPGWSPDGTRLVYERRELSEALPDTDREVPRAWVVSLRDLSTAPLLVDTQMLGWAPLWSPEGREIAVWDRDQGAIVVYDITTGQPKVIPTLEGQSGAFAFDPAGRRLVYPQLTLMGRRYSSELEMVDLQDPAGAVKALSGADNPPVEDKQPDWHPEGERLAFTRRYLDGSGPLNAQVYVLDLDTMTVSPLIVDEAYIHGAPSWSPAGDQLMMQRLDATDPEAAPGIWVYDVDTGALRQLAENAYLPRWLP